MRASFGSKALPAVSGVKPTKGYVERRSWLHPIRSFWRVHAFLLCMLHLMIAVAFCTSRTGLTINGGLLQALIGVCVTHSVLGVVRELLGVFTMHGMLHTQPAVLGSLLLRLTIKVRVEVRRGVRVEVGLGVRGKARVEARHG